METKLPIREEDYLMVQEGMFITKLPMKIQYLYTSKGEGKNERSRKKKKNR